MAKDPNTLNFKLFTPIEINLSNLKAKLNNLNNLFKASQLPFHQVFIYETNVFL